MAAEDISGKELAELKGMIRQLATEVGELKVERENIQVDTSSCDSESCPRYGSGEFYSSTFDSNDGKASDRNFNTVICWRCGQEGHIQVGCRVRIDHLKRPLNFVRPASGGGRLANPIIASAILVKVHLA